MRCTGRGRCRGSNTRLAIEPPSFPSPPSQVLRDMFYDGNAKYEPGAIVCRVAPSFVRFGTFQLPASRGGDQLPLVKATADYVIKHHYPGLQGRGCAPERTPSPSPLDSQGRELWPHQPGGTPARGPSTSAPSSPQVLTDAVTPPTPVTPPSPSP